MALICSKCNYSNSYTSHYCVKCGEPLEKTWIWSLKPDKRYEVIDKTELDSLRNERNRLRKQINDSWGIKLENWIKDNKNTILWTIAAISAFVLVGWIFSNIDFSNEQVEVIEIRKDDTSGKYGIYNNESNTLVTPYEYDSISHRKGRDSYQDWDFYYLHKNGKFGVADCFGRRTISCELDRARGAFNGVTVLYKNGKQGLMDAYGHQILPCEYLYILWENEPKYSSLIHPGTYVGNILPVKTDMNSDWELYDRRGKRIGYKKYYSVTQTGDPRFVKVYERTYEKKGKRYSYTYKYGIVDENGQVIIPCKYCSISTFGNDRAWAKQNYSDSWSLITSTGEKLMTIPKGVTPSAFHDGMAAVTEKGKIGYCDTSGVFVIPMKYEQVRNSDGSYMGFDFYSGKAKVSYNGKPGYIDKTGKFTPDSETK